MAKKKQYTEGQLISLFNLTRIKDEITPKMLEWLDFQVPTLDTVEQHNFDDALSRAKKSIEGWNEEELKMKFISYILPLGYLVDNGRFMTYYEKSLSGEIDGIKLSVKTDFMVAKGILSFHQNPYFHFHEYKPQGNPTGEPMAQLLEAMLLAQEKNQNGKPIYGAEIIGQYWKFVILQGREYCISQSFDSIEKQTLLDIIAILRKFRHILETELLD
jgi:hypothetical protein